MTTVSFTTLGCRLNQAESDAMAEDLASAGVAAAAVGSEPDIVVVNTCTVTREATKASRTAIRRAVRNHPTAKVVVAGCYAVSNREEIEAIEGVHAIVGNDEKERFTEALSSAPSVAPLLKIGMRRPMGLAIGHLDGAPEMPYRVRANLKVQTGCDEWCTFCIIPKTRGPLRSMDEDALIREATERVSAGARELVLTGVHLGKYTFESGGDEKSLVRLFRRLLDIEGVWRLRLSSILSRHLTEEVVSFMANEPRICRHLHVPLQSGDPAILKAMNRPYDIEEYVSSVKRAQGSLPGLALATDIIVGFPGETEDAFERTMEVVKELQFSKLHVFRYSARPDTAAAEMSNEVPPPVRKERSKRLIALGNEIRRRFLAEHLDRPVEVLVEDEREIDGVAVASGQTDDYVRVWFEGAGLLGKMVLVQGSEVRADGIRGARVLRVTRGA